MNNLETKLVAVLTNNNLYGLTDLDIICMADLSDSLKEIDDILSSTDTNGYDNHSVYSMLSRFSESQNKEIIDILLPSIDDYELEHLSILASLALDITDHDIYLYSEDTIREQVSDYINENCENSLLNSILHDSDNFEQVYNQYVIDYSTVWLGDDLKEFFYRM